MEKQAGDAESEKDISRYGFTSSEIVTLGTSVPRISSSSSQEEQNSVLSLTIFSACELLAKFTETKSYVTLKGKGKDAFQHLCQTASTFLRLKDVSSI